MKTNETKKPNSIENDDINNQVADVIAKPTVVKAIEVGEIPKIDLDNASPLVKKSFVNLNKIRDEVNKYFEFADNLDLTHEPVLQVLRSNHPQTEKFNALSQDIANFKKIIRKIEKSFKETNEFVNEQNGTAAAEWLAELNLMLKDGRKAAVKVQNLLQQNSIDHDLIKRTIKETPEMIAKRKLAKSIDTLLIKSFTQLETLRQLVEDANREEKLIYKNSLFKRAKDQREELLVLINNNKNIIKASLEIGKDLYEKIKSMISSGEIKSAFHELDVLGEQVVIARQTWEELFNILAILNSAAVDAKVTEEVTEKIVEEIKKVVGVSAMTKPKVRATTSKAKPKAETVKQPVAKEKTVKQSTTKVETVAKQPTIKAKTVKHPVAKTAAVKHSALKAETVEQPVVKAEIVEQPVVKAKTVEQPTVAGEIIKQPKIKKVKAAKQHAVKVAKEKVAKEPTVKEVKIAEAPKINVENSSPAIKKSYAALEKIKKEVSKYSELAAKIDQSSEVVLKTLQSRNLREDKFNALFQEITNFQAIMGRTEQTIKQAEDLIKDQNELGVSELIDSLYPLVKEARKCYGKSLSIFKQNNVRLEQPKQSAKEKAKEIAKRKRTQDIDILQIKAFTKLETLRQLVEDAHREEKLIYKHNRFRRAKDKRAELLTSIVINKDLISSSLAKGQEIFQRLEYSLSIEELDAANEEFKLLDAQVRIARKAWEELFNILAILNEVSGNSEVTEEVVKETISKIKSEKTVETQLTNRGLQVRLDVIEAKIKNLENNYLHKIDELEAEALVATGKIEGIGQIDSKREITHAVTEIKYAFEQSNNLLAQTKSVLIEENVQKLERDVDRNLANSIETFIKIMVKYLPNISDQKRAGKYRSVAHVNSKLATFQVQIEKADKQMLKYEVLLAYLNDKMKIAEANSALYLNEDGVKALRLDLEHEWEVLMDEVTIVKRHLALAKQCLEDRNITGTSNHIKRFKELHPAIPVEAKHFEFHLAVLMKVKLEKFEPEKMSAIRNSKIVERLAKMLPRYEKLFKRYEVQLIHSNANFQVAMVYANQYHDEAELRDRSAQIQRLLAHLNKMLEGARSMIGDMAKAVEKLSGEEAIKAVNGLKANEDAYIGKHKIDHLEEKIARLSVKERGHAPRWIVVVSVVTLLLAIAATVLVVGGVTGFIKFPKF